MRLILCCGALVLTAAALPAQDIKPFEVKPGLWETTFSNDMGGRAMPAMPQIPPETLANMPPEQRARAEAAMKSRNAGGATTTRSCVTKETLARAGTFGQSDKSCTMKLVTSTPTRQVIHMECNRDGNRMSGDTTIDRIDAEHVKTSTLVKGEGERPIGMKMSFESKYVGADCGNLKPPTPK